MKNSSIIEQYDGLSPLSREWYKRALKLFPNGVTHDSRFLQPYPIYIEKAEGARKWDLEGRAYIDYWSGHGALLLGHGPEGVVRAVHSQIAKGTHLGACHPLEVRWAELVSSLIPSAERIRFTASGTEATLMGVRLSRSYTGRRKLIKFAGHFHGWHDQVILGAQPPFEIPTPGVLQDVIDSTIICPPNDVQALAKVLERNDDIACAIIEPTGASFGTIPTDERFLRPLRELTDRYGIVLIFDEVISGFRVSPGGAQAHYGVIPDLTALAKILAGGYPGGALAGRREIMELLEIRDDPEWMRDRKMPHQGTFNANPVSAAAGIATLQVVRTGAPTEAANEMAARLRKGMNEVIDSFRLNWCVYGTFSEFRYLMGHDLGDLRAKEIDPSVIAYTKLKGAVNPALVQNLRCGLLLHGVDTPAHGGLTMAAHSEEDIDRTIQAFEETLHTMKRCELL